MTAVAQPPSFSSITQTGWGGSGGHLLAQMNPDDIRGALVPRKTIARTNSASSIASTSSTSSTSSNGTVVSSNNQANGAPQSAAGDLSGWPRKRPAPKSQINGARTDNGMEGGRALTVRNGTNGVNGNHNGNGVQSAGQPAPTRNAPSGPPAPPSALYLLSLNGTFERKTISVPPFPETLRIGRQTNARTVPTPMNGYFDSKVLSRVHAEIWSDSQGKIWIRDIKSSNGTFVNGTRLSPENRESEPHELQSGDHLELGIDIVSEDQKQVVHHKVSAKVEHAGLVANSNNLLDMNFGDLDPASGAMIMPVGAGPFRGRAGSQASLSSNGRMSAASGMNGGGQGNGTAYNRNWLASNMTTEVIVKKLRNEMRIARQQAQDIGRTSKFLDALVSNEDIKGMDKPEVPDPPKAAPLPPASIIINGASQSFRSEGKTRFSDPPAPPPQQPLPDKPDIAKSNGEPGSLKRTATERPRSIPPQMSPVRHDNISQIIQLTEAVNSAKREIETQSAMICNLEEMLQKEREARSVAEEAARRLKDDAHKETINSAETTSLLNNTAKDKVDAESQKASPIIISPRSPAHSDDTDDNTTKHFQARIDTMMSEMNELKEQINLYKKQAEQASIERDADRESLAQMVILIRQKDVEAATHKAALIAAKARSKSRSSRGRSMTSRSEKLNGSAVSLARGSTPGAAGSGAESVDDLNGEAPTLSRANTITLTSRAPMLRPSDRALRESIPYASMVGVVLLGMGLMAYLNGWQPPPPTRPDR